MELKHRQAARWGLVPSLVILLLVLLSGTNSFIFQLPSKNFSYILVRNDTLNVVIMSWSHFCHHKCSVISVRKKDKKKEKNREGFQVRKLRSIGLGEP